MFAVDALFIYSAPVEKFSRLFLIVVTDEPVRYDNLCILLHMNAISIGTLNQYVMICNKLKCVQQRCWLLVRI